MSGPEFAAAVVQERAIKEVKSCNLQEPVSKRTFTVLKIQANSGLVGYGKCAVLTTPEFEEVKKVIIGMPVTSYEVVAPLLSKNPKALAGFNIAMLDVFGKGNQSTCLSAFRRANTVKTTCTYFHGSFLGYYHCSS